MSVNRWQVHRAGILNYWYYDEAEFLFAGGRLMLRGSNGSGKSVTMQSLVTVLLDGVTQARRLDSFGSQSRRIEDYLLGEKEISEVDERTGYLFFEYKRQETEQYVTTGIGLHARRGTGRVDFWGFVLQNGRRIGAGLELYRLGHDPETGKTVKIPLSKRELSHAIGADGQVVTSHREYMALVNESVYGFRDIGQYEELMQLLIQLRSPKLSRDFKPTVIYEILNASLPALTDDELRPLSETLANIEQTRLSIEQMGREKAAFERLCRVYTKYNEGVLGKRAHLLQRHRCQLAAAEARLGAIGAEREAAEASCERAQAAQVELSSEEARLREEQKALMSNEAYQAAEEKKQRLDERAQLARRKEQKDRDYESKRRRELALADALRRAEAERERRQAETADALETLADLAGEAAFSEHASLMTDFSLEKADDSLAKIFRERLQVWQAHLRTVRAAFAEIGRRREELVRLEREFSEELRQLDVYQEEKAQADRGLARARSALTERYYEWKAACGAQIPIGEETKLLGLFSDLYETCVWQDVVDLLDAAQTAAQQHVLDAESSVRLALTGVTDACGELERHISVLREAREAEPEQSEEERATRERLRAAGISCQPLYEAVEFRAAVSAPERERIESALTAAGLLQGLILADEAAADGLTQEDYGAILRAGEPVLMGSSLYEYLEPTPDEAAGISAERIAAVLSSIEVVDGVYLSAENGRTCIDVRQGSYAQGAVAGHAPQAEGAHYIGRQAREALRRQQLAEAEAKLADLRAQEAEAQQRLAELAEERKAIREARHAFPEETECRKYHALAQAKATFIEQQKLRVTAKDKVKKESQLQLREKLSDLHELCGADALEKTEDAYAAAESVLEEYRQELADLFRKAGDARAAAQMEARDREDLAVMQEEANRLRGEQLEIEARMAWLQARIEGLDKVLARLDAAAVEQRIAAIAARLRVLPEEMRSAVREETEAQGSLKRLAEEAQRLDEECGERRQLVAAAEKLVAAERTYAFLPADELTEKGTAALARAQSDDTAMALSRLFSRVSSVYQESQSVLTEYRLILQDAETELSLPTGGKERAAGAEAAVPRKVLFPDEWHELKEYSTRQLVLTESGSRRESPYTERQALAERLAEQQDLLSEQDRELYEKIIMNSIGTTISSYIYEAEHWVEKMNEIMAQSETSSGLRFHLSWRPDEKAESEDLRGIVRLLHADPGTLIEEDREKLTGFFKTRVERARMLADADEKSADAWSPAVRDMLDYRKWFVFQLYYDKGEKIRRRPMTDRSFFQFSGGEKAMAMYAPLFSAAYSRYQEAAPDAPYLITLDEAFAGVDEQNMRDMFRLVESMHFNYIMNSQAVWGEYDVVPELNIYNLMRPLNAAFVTLIKFHWDGHVRRPLVEEEEDAERGSRPLHERKAGAQENGGGFL